MIRFWFGLVRVVFCFALMGIGSYSAFAAAQAEPSLFFEGQNPHLLWQEFKYTYLAADGRVIDRQNADKSHSEGQGYALFLAQYFNEPEVFKRIFTWSQNNLGPGLKAWAWGKKGTSWGVLDHNNATDGDILHAWALLLAGERWKDAQYTATGLSLLKQLRECCISQDGLLLPGQEGFRKLGGTVVNASYYLFPALADFARLDVNNTTLWQRTLEKGMQIVQEGSCPRSDLPYDWVLVTKEGLVKPYPQNKGIFGYEAIRVPLYLAGAGKKKLLAPYEGLIRQITQDGSMPACIGTNGEKACPEEAGYGHYAIMARVAFELGLHNESKRLLQLCEQKKAVSEGYYDAILAILAIVI